MDAATRVPRPRRPTARTPRTPALRALVRRDVRVFVVGGAFAVASVLGLVAWGLDWIDTGVPALVLGPRRDRGRRRRVRRGAGDARPHVPARPAVPGRDAGRRRALRRGRVRCSRSCVSVAIGLVAVYFAVRAPRRARGVGRQLAAALAIAPARRALATISAWFTRALRAVGAAVDAGEHERRDGRAAHACLLGLGQRALDQRLGLRGGQRQLGRRRVGDQHGRRAPELPVDAADGGGLLGPVDARRDGVRRVAGEEQREAVACRSRRRARRTSPGPRASSARRAATSRPTRRRRRPCSRARSGRRRRPTSARRRGARRRGRRSP